MQNMSQENTYNKQVNEIKVNFMALQKDIEYTKEKVQSIDNKLNHFINTADSKYARCEDLTKQRERIEDQEKKLDNMNRFLNKVLITAVIALIGFIATLFKDAFLNSLNI